MTHGIGQFETSDRRLARLRAALDATAQSMGDTVSQAVDLEARRRAMEENLQRFREVERRPSSIIGGQAGGRLFDVPTGLEPTRFPPSPSPSGRFVDRLDEPVQEQRVNPFRHALYFLYGTRDCQF